MNYLNWLNRQDIVLFIQHTISLVGILIILSGILLAFYQYIIYFFFQRHTQDEKINFIRLDLSRTLILGLEFIVAADLIATTTAPDYYSVGIVAIIVVIRTVLSYSLNREIAGLSGLVNQK